MFTKGDRLLCIKSSGAAEQGEYYTFDRYHPTDRYIVLQEFIEQYPHHNSRADAFQLAPPIKPTKGLRGPVEAPKTAGEADPLGKSQHAPGAKLDAGKVQPALIIEGMPRALWAVSAVATFGAAKYTPNGWVSVPNGETRYANAGYRHVLKRAMGEQVDPDSELDHLAHEAWNALAKLELALLNKEKIKV